MDIFIYGWMKMISMSIFFDFILLTWYRVYGEMLVRVYPYWNPAPSHSYHSVINDLTDNEAKDFYYWSDCFRITAAVMGGIIKCYSDM